MSPVFEHGALRLYLLKLLAEQPRHGYELMQQIEDRFHGLYTPSAGTVYPRLARLHVEGLVEPAEGKGARKTYRITDAGRTELAERGAELADLEVQVAGSARDLAREIRADVRATVKDLRAEIKQAARQVRHDHRHATSPSTDDLQRDLAALERAVLDAAARASSEQVAKARQVLAEARTRAVAALRD